MKRLITGLILVASLVLVSCAPSTQVKPPTTTTATPSPTPPGVITVPGLPGQPLTGRESVYSVEIGLVPSKLTYLPGEPVQMALTLTNASRGEVEPVYVSPLPPGISIVIPNTSVGGAKPGTREYFERMNGSKIIKTFAPGAGEKKLAAGEKATHDLTWDQKDKAGNQVVPGWYFYESNINFRMSSASDITGSGVRERAFLIQYPQGAMAKVIELNQSSTVTGQPLTVGNETRLVDIVFTLERVELSEERASFIMLVTSPGNPLTYFGTNMEARYEADGIIKYLQGGNRHFIDSGVEIQYGYGGSFPDPIPGDAKELTLVITSFSDWQGPWEFKVPLQ